TNGKAERFIRTLLERWAYAYPYERESERLAALAPALDFYNRFRPHRALGGLAPLQRVNNPPGTYNKLRRGEPDSNAQGALAALFDPRVESGFDGKRTVKSARDVLGGGRGTGHRACPPTQDRSRETLRRRLMTSLAHRGGP